MEDDGGNGNSCGGGPNPSQEARVTWSGLEYHLGVCSNACHSNVLVHNNILGVPAGGEVTRQLQEGSSKPAPELTGFPVPSLFACIHIGTFMKLDQQSYWTFDHVK